MKSTKALFLFLALILPICIFIFLKFFGRNEFEVKPLFEDSPPKLFPGCQQVGVPYVVADSIKAQLELVNDSLVVVAFNTAGENQLRRIKQEIANLPVGLLTLPESERHLFWKRCVFLMNEPLDLVLIDAKGRLRGQYVSSDRDEVDRLLTEVTIILKRY